MNFWKRFASSNAREASDRRAFILAIRIFHDEGIVESD